MSGKPAGTGSSGHCSWGLQCINIQPAQPYVEPNSGLRGVSCLI
jgi:hypothetical protein